MAEPKDFLYVRSGRTDNKVAFSEVDDAHPGGSAFVAQNMARKIGNTNFANEALRAGLLVETNDGESKKQADEYAKGVMSGEESAAVNATVSHSDDDLRQMAKDRNIDTKGMSRNDVMNAVNAHDSGAVSHNNPPGPQPQGQMHLDDEKMEADKQAAAQQKSAEAKAAGERK